jgi:hypothetical protein
VKETVENIKSNEEKTTLTIDQLDEALLLFQNAKVPKIDNQIKAYTKSPRSGKSLKTSRSM